MSFFTYFIEYKNDLKILQLSSPDISKANRSIIQRIEANSFDEFSSLNGITNGWCLTTEINGIFSLVNIIKTKKDKRINEKNLFTLLLYFNGGTYIYQKIASDIETFMKRWIVSRHFKFITGENRRKELLKKLSDKKIVIVKILKNVWKVETSISYKNIIIYLVATDNKD